MTTLAFVFLGIAILLFCLALFEKVPQESDLESIVSSSYREGYQAGYEEGELKK